MIPNEKFKIEVVTKGDKPTAMLHGIIDEDSTFEKLASAGKSVTVNFKNVTSINSLGVRNWVNFLKEIPGTEIFYQECPPLIVRQLNMVPSFLAHAKVLSVFVPYVCDNCETESLVLLESSSFHNKNSIPETKPCESCKKGEMELDGHPQQYFAFAK